MKNLLNFSLFFALLLHTIGGSAQVTGRPGPASATNGGSASGTNQNAATGADAATPPSSNANALNAYVNSLNYDPRVLLAVEADGGTLLRETPKDTKTDRQAGGGDEVIICTKTNYSLSTNFDEVVVLQPTNGIVYPGALIYADQNLVRGQPRPLTSVAPGGVRLTIDLPGMGDKGTFSIKNPSNGSVQAGIESALKFWNEGPAYKEGYINAARSSSSAAVSYSSEQLGLGLGVDVKWASGSVSSQFSFKSTSEKKVAVMMFKQVFYTVTSEPPANPANAFHPSVTLAQAKAAFGVTTPPAYIQSVSYGRIIMFRLETSENVTEADLKATLKYAAGAIEASGSVEVHYKNILRNSSVTYALLGGNAEVESNIASAQNFADLEPLIKGKNSVYSKSNPGVPIGYTVRFLKDHQIAKMGSTTDYSKEECKHYPNMKVKLVHDGWYVAKYTISYFDRGQPVVQERHEKHRGWSETFYFPGDATGVRIQGWAATGLVWDPWGEIYNKLLTPAELAGKCFRNGGTTLNRSYDDNCSF